MKLEKRQMLSLNICDVPGDDLWESNLKKREMDGMIQRYKEQAAYDIEFPNPAEGIDRIYKVTDGEICLQMEPPRPEILDKARKELAGEAERIRCEDDERRKEKRTFREHEYKTVLALL